MKKLLLATLVLFTVSCSKQTVTQQKDESAYFSVIKFTNFTVPYVGVRVDYTVNSDVSSVNLMVDTNDGHGWTQHQNYMQKSNYFIGASYFKYYWVLTLKNNTTFVSTTKGYPQ